MVPGRPPGVPVSPAGATHVFGRVMGPYIPEIGTIRRACAAAGAETSPRRACVLLPGLLSSSWLDRNALPCITDPYCRGLPKIKAEWLGPKFYPLEISCLGPT